MDSSTQDFLEIKDIKEGVLVLKNGNLRGVLMVSSMNFALKSDESQQSIIFAFQNFLNSLDFACQIVVQSRKINITPYLDTIKNLEEQQENELLRAQTASYREFIKEMVSGDTIMTKNFYIVVPYNLLEIMEIKSAVKKLDFLGFSKKKGSDGREIVKDEDFEKYKNQLWQRMEFLAMGIKRCGLEVMPLTTQALIELFWAMHHPSEAEIGYNPEIAPEMLR
ncbi:MAG: hypothetical protein AAB877_00220 [Patescibacteria group bacterium]